jgi:hypothetical protein
MEVVMSAWREVFSVNFRWGDGEFSFRIGWFWLIIFVLLIWWGLS